MNGYINDSVWDKYKSIINNAHYDFNQATIVWKKHNEILNRFNDDSVKPTFTDIPLKGLIQYNMFRTWPMTQETDSGALDAESITVYFNNQYLSDLGYITEEGNFGFDPGKDYFTYKGQFYRSSGETPVSQAKDTDLFTFLILKRVPTETGDTKY